MGNVSVTNELSFRPERSEVEGPAVPRTSIQFDRKHLLFIGSNLSCLRQLGKGLKEVREAVIIATTPNGSAALPFVIPSGAEGSAVVLACGEFECNKRIVIPIGATVPSTHIHLDRRPACSTPHCDLLQARKICSWGSDLQLMR
jgi:hypothetical protein